MSVKTEIKCPDCQSPIFIESNLLLAGQSFKCSNPNCHTSISLSLSETQKVAKAFNEFQQIRQNAVEQAQKYE
ncbi:hypothetical protein [Marinomonas sp. THO17]|uniref:hypothetical protein n=1 Tax=Marinomonas sp. THO17 TaxID=3149048 RepID=UPI00336BF67A